VDFDGFLASSKYVATGRTLEMQLMTSGHLTDSTNTQPNTVLRRGYMYTKDLSTQISNAELWE